METIVLFDGVCNFCNSSVNFLLKIDKASALKFAANQSEAGKKILSSFGRPTENIETILVYEEGKLYEKSEAALRIVSKLPSGWKILRIFAFLPLSIRDALYDLIARNRYRLFGKREACRIPKPEERSRFLD